MNNVDIVINLYLLVVYGNPHFSSASMLKLGYEARLIYALAFLNYKRLSLILFN